MVSTCFLSEIRSISNGWLIKFSDFLNALKESKIDYTLDGLARLSRSHGQTLYDIYSLRHGKCFPRISDIVVWPGKYYL